MFTELSDLHGNVFHVDCRCELLVKHDRSEHFVHRRRVVRFVQVEIDDDLARQHRRLAEMNRTIVAWQKVSEPKRAALRCAIQSDEPVTATMRVPVASVDTARAIVAGVETRRERSAKLPPCIVTAPAAPFTTIAVITDIMFFFFFFFFFLQVLNTFRKRRAVVPLPH